jgi:hypothetical protein
MAKSMDIIHPQDDEDRSTESEKIETEEEDFEMEEPKGTSGTFYLVLGIVALVLASGITLYILFFNNKSTSTGTASTAEASETAQPEASITVSPTAIASPATTASTTAVTKSGKVRVSNGNSINGEGKRIAGILTTAGFDVISTGNATKTYTQTIVYYKAGSEDLANSLVNAIKAEYKATTEQSDAIATKFGANAVIALGSK